MKLRPTRLLVVLLNLGVLVGLAACSDYKLENRPQVVFSGRGGDRVHVSPYPMSESSAAIWKSDACWRSCGAKCAAAFNECGKVKGAEVCRSKLDHCDDMCVFECRKGGGPFLYSFE
jgi:hypothetical protein